MLSYSLPLHVHDVAELMLHKQTGWNSNAMTVRWAGGRVDWVPSGKLSNVGGGGGPLITWMIRLRGVIDQNQALSPSEGPGIR